MISKPDNSRNIWSKTNENHLTSIQVEKKIKKPLCKIGKTKTGMKKPRKTGIVNLIHCSIMSKEYEYYTKK